MGSGRRIGRWHASCSISLTGREYRALPHRDSEIDAGFGAALDGAITRGSPVLSVIGCSARTRPSGIRSDARYRVLGLDPAEIDALMDAATIRERHVECGSVWSDGSSLPFGCRGPWWCLGKAGRHVWAATVYLGDVEVFESGLQ